MQTLAAVNLAPNVWTQIIDGATLASFGIQVVSNGGVKIAVADALPATDAQNFFILGSSGIGDFSGELLAGNKVYGMPFGADTSAIVRGYGIAR